MNTENRVEDEVIEISRRLIYVECAITKVNAVSSGTEKHLKKLVGHLTHMQGDIVSLCFTQRRSR